MWRYTVPVALLAVLGVFFFRGLHLNPGFVPSPLVGKPVPQFSVATLHDAEQQLTNADFGNDVALLNVWGTWCPACRQEHPFLLELARTSGVPIFGLEWNDVDRAAGLAWLQQLGNPYVKTGFDATGAVAIDWGVYGAPETFLVDGDGQILYKHIAPMTPDVWRNEFLPRIEQARAAKGSGLAERDGSG